MFGYTPTSAELLTVQPNRLSIIVSRRAVAFQSPQHSSRCFCCVFPHLLDLSKADMFRMIKRQLMPLIARANIALKNGRRYERRNPAKRGRFSKVSGHLSEIDPSAPHSPCRMLWRDRIEKQCLTIQR